MIDPDDRLAKYAFKTPGPRNLIDRAPFGHAGQLADLDAIVTFDQGGGIERPSNFPLRKRIALTGTEHADLVAFLRSLTTDETETALPNLPN